ncbi:hypothetical protein DFH07DRAFT_765701 [Mycena maculata]|uniref:Uncharacterized protein n=1 Tax=Mycena maculata TaxID=230809 RepID=A0AAD7K6W5_9AGAR|nr:hypothetical protein DFH07DRAFT_765701 [Mycena maculata]
MATFHLLDPPRASWPDLELRNLATPIENHVSATDLELDGYIQDHLTCVVTAALNLLTQYLRGHSGVLPKTTQFHSPEIDFVQEILAIPPILLGLKGNIYGLHIPQMYTLSA